MDDIRLGIRFRALRQRLDWRQDDLARRSGVSQDTISRIEPGQIAMMPMRTLRAVAHELQAEVVVQFRWRGAELDRLCTCGMANRSHEPLSDHAAHIQRAQSAFADRRVSHGRIRPSPRSARDV